MKFNGMPKGVGCLAIVTLFHPRLSLNVESAGAIGIQQQGLGGFDERIVRAVRIQIANRQSHMCLSGILPRERSTVQLRSLRKSAFCDTNVPQASQTQR